MHKSISLSYIRDQSDPSLTIMELFRLANKNHMALDWEEARELLELIKHENQIRSFSGSKLVKLIDEIRYDNAFGRMLSCDEERELLSNSHQVLVDD